MQTYLKWLTRLLTTLAVACAAVAAYAYLNQSPDGLDGGGAIAILYAALVGALGFGFTAIATHFIARRMDNS